MTEVTNNGKQTPIGLPGGTLVGPGQTATVKNWEKIKGHPVVAHYLSHGVLTVSEGAPDTAEDEKDEKAALIAELATYGIEANSRSKVETLRAKLEEAKEAQQQENQ